MEEKIPKKNFFGVLIFEEIYIYWCTPSVRPWFVCRYACEQYYSEKVVDELSWKRWNRFLSYLCRAFTYLLTCVTSVTVELYRTGLIWFVLGLLMI